VSRTRAGIGIVTAGLFALTGCMAPPFHHPMAPMHGGGPMGRAPLPARTVPPMPLPTLEPSASPTFKRDIQPIFTRACVRCHGGAAGLWLDRYEGVMTGSARGPVVIPGNPEASELYRRITGRSQPAMPLGGPPLSPEEIERIRRWIAAGAPEG